MDLGLSDKGTDPKWVDFFKPTNSSNLQILIELVLFVPVSNALVERVFCIIQNLWTDELYRMCAALVEAALLGKFNSIQTIKTFSY